MVGEKERKNRGTEQQKYGFDLVREGFVVFLAVSWDGVLLTQFETHESGFVAGVEVAVGVGRVGTDSGVEDAL